MRVSKYKTARFYCQRALVTVYLLGLDVQKLTVKRKWECVSVLIFDFRGITHRFSNRREASEVKVSSNLWCIVRLDAQIPMTKNFLLFVNLLFEFYFYCKTRFLFYWPEEPVRWCDSNHYTFMILKINKIFQLFNFWVISWTNFSSIDFK